MELEITEFQKGSDAMTRHCLAAVELVKRQVWTMDDVEQWLRCVLINEYDRDNWVKMVYEKLNVVEHPLTKVISEQFPE